MRERSCGGGSSGCSTGCTRSPRRPATGPMRRPAGSSTGFASGCARISRRSAAGPPRPPAPLERPPRPHLHGEPRGDEALPEVHPGAGHRGDRPRRRAHRGDRWAHAGRPAQGDPEAVQRRPGRRSLAHPAGHRRGARGPELPGPLRRPVPLRPAVEPGTHRAAERPHRPQAAAGAGGALPLLRAAAARRGSRTRGPRPQDRDPSSASSAACRR